MSHAYLHGESSASGRLDDGSIVSQVGQNTAHSQQSKALKRCSDIQLQSALRCSPMHAMFRQMLRTQDLNLVQ